MRNKEKGELTEQIVITELMKRGFPVSKPIGDNQPYDLILDTANKLWRVQVRTCYLRNNNTLSISFQSHRANTKKTCIKYLSDCVDVVMGYSYETNKVYVIDRRLLDINVNSISLRINDSRNGQIKNIKYAYDYELDNYMWSDGI